MASVNQDFTKWEGDTFVIQFTINDAEIELNNYKAYWACSPVTASLAPSYVNASSNKAIVKTTSGYYGNIGGITYSSYNKFRVSITPSDTTNLTSGSFYHELTLDSVSPGNQSVVVSSGIFTLQFPLFPEGNR
jgi:hypothetical protein